MMTKNLNRNLALMVAGALCLLNTLPAQAAAPSKSGIEQLEQQVQLLMQQNQQVHQRISDLEKSVQAQPAASKTEIEEEVARQVKENSSGPGINEYVSLSGSIEGDYKLGKDFQSGHSSAFVLDTVDLILDVKVTDWATGKLVVEYDGTSDNDDLYLDEAHITLGKTGTFPFFLTGGKIYVPFGDFSTNMIQDPLTQTVGEINSKGVIAGFEQNGVNAAVFSYAGMSEGSDPADDDKDSINGFGASLAYSYQQETMGFNAGMAWVNNIGDSSTITDYLESANGKASVHSLANQVSGLSLNLGGNYKAFSLTTEYLTALDSFTFDELPSGAEGAEPGAWNSELAYTTAIMDKETVFAVGYQKSWAAVALELPEQRSIAAVSMGIFNGTTLTFEYHYDQDYSVDDGGTGNNGYGFTTRLTYKF